MSSRERKVHAGERGANLRMRGARILSPSVRGGLSFLETVGRQNRWVCGFDALDGGEIMEFMFGCFYFLSELHRQVKS